MEAGAVDNGLGNRQSVHYDGDGMVVARGIAISGVQLVGDVDGVEPLGTVGQDDVDGEDVGIDVAPVSMGAVAESAEAHLQRRLVDGAAGESLGDGAFAGDGALHPYRGRKA